MSPESSRSLRRALISFSLRALFCLGLALIGCAKSHAQVLLNIDYSNLSAVKITATGDFPATSYSGVLDDGLDLLNVFTSSVYVQDFVSGSPGSYVSTYNVSSTGLTDGINGNEFKDLAAWNSAHPEYWGDARPDTDTPYYGAPSSHTGIDLTLWTYNGGAMGFDATHTFQGQAIFDLSGYSSYTNLFPVLNAAGDIVGHSTSTVLGQWQVVAVSAVPEPSTYAALIGAAALLGTIALRRRMPRRS